MTRRDAPLGTMPILPALCILTLALVHMYVCNYEYGNNDPACPPLAPISTWQYLKHGNPATATCAGPTRLERA